MEEKRNTNDANSPSNSQKTISDDDEIDYSIKPEFYDSELDDKDEEWVEKQRKGRSTDAVLSCPACLQPSASSVKGEVVLGIQVFFYIESCRHETYVTQYRAIFVTNCQVEPNKVRQERIKPTRSKRKRGSSNEEAPSADAETFKSVICSVCSTEVGVIDADEVYHFFNVLPSEA